MIRTLLVLEGRLVRGALAHLLSRQADLRVVGEFDGLTEVEATTIAERPDVTVVDPNLKNMMLMNWFFGVQRSIMGGVVVEANYIGNLGHHLGRRTRLRSCLGRARAADGVLDLLQNETGAPETGTPAPLQPAIGACNRPGTAIAAATDK